MELNLAFLFLNAIQSLYDAGLTTYIITLVFILGTILTVANDEYVWGYVVLLGWIALLEWLTPLTPVIWMWNNPGDTLGMLLTYAAIGILMTVIKYRSFLAYNLDAVKRLKIRFISENELSISVTDTIPAEYSSKWRDYKRFNLPGDVHQALNKGLKPGDNITKIINWTAYWPFLFIGNIVADPIWAFFKGIYHVMAGMLGRMYTRMVSSRINLDDI